MIAALLRTSGIPLTALALVGLWLGIRLQSRNSSLESTFGYSGGGDIVSVGGNRYHFEAVVADGTMRLYTLGADGSRVIDIEEQSLTAYVQSESDTQAVPIELRPQPQVGDTPGRTSCFVGHLPENLKGQVLTVSIPKVQIQGQWFHVSFRYPVTRR